MYDAEDLTPPEKKQIVAVHAAFRRTFYRLETYTEFSNGKLTNEKDGIEDHIDEIEQNRRDHSRHGRAESGVSGEMLDLMHQHAEGELGRNIGMSDILGVLSLIYVFAAFDAYLLDVSLIMLATIYRDGASKGGTKHENELSLRSKEARSLERGGLCERRKKWRKTFGVDIADGLSDDQFEWICVWQQVRHCFVHRGGQVDEDLLSRAPILRKEKWQGGKNIRVGIEVYKWISRHLLAMSDSVATQAELWLLQCGRGAGI